MRNVKLGDYLVEKGKISALDVEKALKEQKRSGRKIGDSLVYLGILDEEELADELSEYLGVRRIRDLEKEECLKGIMDSYVREYRIVPIRIEEDVLYIATYDPINIGLTDDLEKSIGYRVVPEIATYSEIEGVIKRNYESKEEGEGSIIDVGEREEEDVIGIVNEIVEGALEKKASDIHVEPGREDVKVRYRIDGVLRDEIRFGKFMHASIISRIKIMAGMDITEKRVPQDGRDSSFREDVDLRISVIPTILGEKAVLRVLDKGSRIMDLPSLGFNEEEMESIKRNIVKPFGLFLLTGPTGSGKTTTLYAVLKEILSREINIVTVEDPPEYEIEGISQIEVNYKTGLIFSKALRSIVRQDPDVIMVGEIRDEDTAKIAVEAALTGHLVLSTLHTNDSSSAPARLIDMGVESYLVASSLISVVSQRLVRLICENCKKEYYLEKESPLRNAFDRPDDKFYKGEGCKKCEGLGYKGRAVVAEILEVGKGVRESIPYGVDEVREIGFGKRNQKLYEKAQEKAYRGEITPDEAAKVIFRVDE